MACYNAERYVGEAISSLLYQTFSDFELIIVDDASTDSSASIAKQFAEKDPRIQVHVMPANSGPAVARNAAIQIATGEWLAVLDADDVSLPQRLEAEVAYVDSHPRTVLVGSGFIEIDAGGKSLRAHMYPEPGKKYNRYVRRTGCFPPHSSCLYHKATVESLGGFNPRFRRSQDADLWFRLLLSGEIAALPMPLVKIRKHEDCISNDARGQTQTLFGIAARVCHFTRVQGVPDPSRQSDTDWEDFMEWLAARVEQRGVFEQKQDWVDLRRAYYSSSNEVVRGYRLLKGLVGSRYGLRILLKKYFGWSLPSELANEWIQRQCAVS